MKQKLSYMINGLVKKLKDKRKRVCPALSCWGASGKKSICTLVVPNILFVGYKESPSPCPSGNCDILEELSMCWPNVKDSSLYNGKLVSKALKFYRKFTGDDI